MEYRGLQSASPPLELTCHIVLSATPQRYCNIPDLPQPIKAGTRFSDPGGHEMVYLSKDSLRSQY